MKKDRTKIFTLGHSPDPDHAFIFYAIAENRIDLRGYRFEHRVEDIQTLNERLYIQSVHPEPGRGILSHIRALTNSNRLGRFADESS
jgi:menaquinone biosynthesis protein